MKLFSKPKETEAQAVRRAITQAINNNCMVSMNFNGIEVIAITPKSDYVKVYKDLRIAVLLDKQARLIKK